MAERVYVSGLRECLAALSRVNKDVRQDITWELAEAAKPVARSAQEKISRYQEASISTIGPRVASTGVFVTQRARKVTGKRGDFGALQMRKGMIPALWENEGEIVQHLEAAVDRLVAAFGRG